MAVLGTVIDSEKRKKETKIINGIKCIRFDGDLFFVEDK